MARLLHSRWPGLFVAEGASWKLDMLVCRSIGVLVWIDGVTEMVPGGSGMTLVMVPPRFDPEITIRCVAKQLRRRARQRFRV